MQGAKTSSQQNKLLFLLMLQKGLCCKNYFILDKTNF
jgi:hypothetical protein